MTEVNTAAAEQIPIDASTPVLSIVIVSFNNRKYLEPCLESLYGAGLVSTFDVVVVDNGSTDGSQDLLREKFPMVKLLQNDKNVGLGKASNQGIEATTGKYILLLNDDTLISEKSFDSMVDFFEATPDAGAVGGCLLNSDGSVQSCYNDFPTLWEEFMISTRLGELVHPGYPAKLDGSQVQEVSWMSSACLMLRRKALDDVGLLDEDYFIYGDEVDIQYRLIRAGWKNYNLPQATTIHFGGRSMERWPRRKMVYRGKMLFFKKNYGQVRTWALRLMLGSLSLFKFLLWGLVYLGPPWRERARRELASNSDVIKLCWNLSSV